MSVGFIFLLGFSERWSSACVPGLPDQALVWVAFGSALMFMTALNVALGVDIAGGLMVESDSASTYALHTAGFMLAAPGGVGRHRLLRRYRSNHLGNRELPPVVGMAAIVGALANVGAVLGIVSLTGPLNSGNGIVGGIAAPLGLYLVWIFAISVWWLRGGQPNRHAGIATRPVPSQQQAHQ